VFASSAAVAALAAGCALMLSVRDRTIAVSVEDVS
jgi:hypothetical protein